MGSDRIPHFALFPFLSQGHLIPILYLGRLLRRHSAAVTVFTTPKNVATVKAIIRDADDIDVVILPFPQNIDGVPAGVENTHDLPSMESFLPFARATTSMKESFEEGLRTLRPPASAVISDMFLGWTLSSAAKFQIPRYVFSGMGNFASAILIIVSTQRPQAGTESVDEEFSLKDFPAIKLTRNDFEPPFNEVDPTGPHADFVAEQYEARIMSQGSLVNSAHELEKEFEDYLNTKFSPRVISAGPFCLTAETPPLPPSTASYIKFLDIKQGEGESVLYVSFGTQAEISRDQIKEIATGLENSGVNFLWALRTSTAGDDFFDGFENRVKNRGAVIREWVDQLLILRHEAVKGSLSHCGWNSVTESISAGVPILAMPFMA
ncbi:hypothetical protein M569_16586, partial [Genlisea aurea]